MLFVAILVRSAPAGVCPVASRQLDNRITLSVLEHLFRHRVLQMLLGERRIDETRIRTLLGWRHSGFSLHNAVRIGAHEAESRRAVAEFILRSPLSLDKLRYHPRTGTVIYRKKMHPVLERNCEVFSACDWLAALTAHIPNAGEHLVRYYGWYRNVSRGKRRKAQGENSSRIEEFRDVSASAAKRARARLIKQVYEVDPLICPHCGVATRILAFIEQSEVIDLPVPGTCLRLPVAFAAVGVEPVGLKSLLRASDIVMVHSLLSAETRRIICQKTLRSPRMVTGHGASFRGARGPIRRGQTPHSHFKESPTGGVLPES